MIALGLLFGTFLGTLMLGAPVALAMALAVGAYAIAFPAAFPEIVLVQSFMQGLDNSAFLAIPYFFLAGAIMNLGGMSARLMRLARAALSHLRGGLSHANIGASVVFAGVSGSAVADAAAVGSVMIPAMRREGYPGAYAAAVTAASATIGLVIPPSIPMVIFGLFTGADIGALFLGGVVPGLAMGAFLIAASMILSVRRGYPRTPWQGWGELGAATRGASLALAMPVLVAGGLVLGFATTAEIGAVAALYAALVSWGIYREASLGELWRACVGAAIDSARVLIIVAISGGFVWIIASLGVARDMAAAIEATGLEGRALLLLIAVVLLLLGTVLEPITLLVVVVPLMVPAALAGGIDIVHLGVTTILAVSIGLITPPVGVLLYVTAAQAEARALDVIVETLPFLAALLLLLGVVVAVPGLTTWLPGLTQHP